MSWYDVGCVVAGISRANRPQHSAPTDAEDAALLAKYAPEQLSREELDDG